MAAKRKLKPASVIISMVAVIVSMVTIDSIRRDIFRVNTNEGVKVEDGHFISQTADGMSVDGTLPFNFEDEPTTAFEGIENVGYSQVTVSKDGVSKGLLAIADDAHPVAPIEESDTVDLFKAKNEYYTLIEQNVQLSKDAAEAFNMMMADYYAEYQLTDFVVYGTTDTYTAEGSYCPRHFAESAAGNCVDLALCGWESVISYDGADTQGWVNENCYKYGFILRYPEDKEDITEIRYEPWHFRYVGIPHAYYMTKNGICLEEYIELLRSYTYDGEHLAFTDHNGQAYEVYFVPADASADQTPIPVPPGAKYDVSGNNIDGFIVTITAGESADPEPAAEPSTEASTDAADEETSETPAE